MAETRGAVVLLSGGQDSATCLAWAMPRFSPIYTLTIDYGQRHRIEIAAAAAIARASGLPHAVLPCDSFRALGGNALTSDEAIQPGVRPGNQLPNTFVPGRNLIFLTLAAAYAYQRGVVDLVTGVCQTDYSGYPDCRAGTLDALQEALRLGLEFPIQIHAPLMDLTKAQTVRLMQSLHGMPLLALSHTCYEGAVPPCGRCPACILRAKGFAEAGVADPLLDRHAGPA
jgi:7-cyano-7-deazaguanine synthase